MNSAKTATFKQYFKNPHFIKFTKFITKNQPTN